MIPPGRRPSSSIAPLAVGLTVAMAIHVLMLPAAIVAMQQTAHYPNDSLSRASLGAGRAKPLENNPTLHRPATELPASPKVSQAVQEHARRSATASPASPPASPPAPTARDQTPPAVSLKKTTPPKLRLGSRNGDPHAATAAWISYEDFQKLQAPKGRQEQPALQKESDPAPGAPYRPDPTSHRMAMAANRTGSSGGSGSPAKAFSPMGYRSPLLYPIQPPTGNPADAMRTMPGTRPAESIIPLPMADMTAPPGQTSPFPPLTGMGPSNPPAASDDSPPSLTSTNASSGTTASLRPSSIPAESLPGQTSQARGQILLTPNPGSATTPSHTLSPSSSPSSSDRTKRASAASDSSSPAHRSGSAQPAEKSPEKARTTESSKGSQGGSQGGNEKASASPKADKESHPVSLHDGPVLIRPGQVITGRGIEIKTSVPRLSVVARFVLPSNPVIKVTFDSHGDVVQAEFIRTSGYENWDGPVLASLYRWKAQGPMLDDLKRGFELEVELLFTDSPP